MEITMHIKTFLITWLQFASIIGIPIAIGVWMYGMVGLLIGTIIGGIQIVVFFDKFEERIKRRIAKDIEEEERKYA
jgi:asparagine N-glycosylation enzyme membrane subunit Stt3